MNIQWKKNVRRFESGESAYLGKWRVGGYSYSVSASRNDPNVWDLHCSLPGLDRRYPAVATEEDARNGIERLIRHWLDNIHTEEEQAERKAAVDHFRQIISDNVPGGGNRTEAVRHLGALVEL